MAKLWLTLDKLCNLAY